ncbi:MAG: hypothetical protein OXF02_06740 [Simkaniaceae bacterium]|nr:hypothetical protein [Simkaniaceae bacterium]
MSSLSNSVSYAYDGSLHVETAYGTVVDDTARPQPLSSVDTARKVDQAVRLKRQRPATSGKSELPEGGVRVRTDCSGSANHTQVASRGEEGASPVASSDTPSEKSTSTKSHGLCLVTVFRWIVDTIRRMVSCLMPRRDGERTLLLAEEGPVINRHNVKDMRNYNDTEVTAILTRVTGQQASHLKKQDPAVNRQRLARLLETSASARCVAGNLLAGKRQRY